MIKLENILKEIPEHVFLKVSKQDFLKFVENVLFKVESLEKINIPAAISFLKMKFINGETCIESNCIIIQNQCNN
tara:strand:- start:572 stop:796 length:225 start_codon:yes stop_codon:yes gene_type:complete